MSHEKVCDCVLCQVERAMIDLSIASAKAEVAKGRLVTALAIAKRDKADPAGVPGLIRRIGRAAEAFAAATEAAIDEFEAAWPDREREA